ncbi:MAG: hypothetical protein QXQ53_04420 [Candidatus Methanosuratincola sp.]
MRKWIAVVNGKERRLLTPRAVLWALGEAGTEKIEVDGKEFVLETMQVEVPLTRHGLKELKAMLEKERQSFVVSVLEEIVRNGF